MTESTPGTQLRQLTQDDPQGRRNAAIRLGKSGDPRQVRPLVEALKRETDDDARASIILAVGALGGPEAVRALETINPTDEPSRVALRKALGRLGAQLPAAEWKDGIALPSVCLEIPEGLERPAALLLIKAEWPRAIVERPGLLRLEEPVPAGWISPPPRWCYKPRILLGTATGDNDDAQASILRAIAADPPWAQWITVGGSGGLPYRLMVEGRTFDKGTFARLVQMCRAFLEPAGAFDSPSSCLAELVFAFTDGSTRLYFRPNFGRDDRFAYRERDVGASMNPVVAAALARLAPPGLSGAIIDPVCGSGVPLIERALFDPHAGPVVGIDISPVAVSAAKINVAAAGLAERATIHRADACDPAAWHECGLVIANLPYGLRTRSSKDELQKLYSGVVRRAEEFLTEKGRVIIATAYKDGLERAIKSPRLRTLARYRVQTGGLYVQVAVLGRN
jgi:RMKL-like, methyltransferase domain/HEAT repeats